MSINATDIDSNIQKNVKIADDYTRLMKDDIERMISEGKKNESEDEAIKKKIEAKIEL